MIQEFTLKVVSAQSYVGIRDWVRPMDMGAFFGKALPETFRYLREKGVTPATPPLALYFAHDENRGTFDLLGGFFTKDPMEAEAPFISGPVAPGEAISVRHIGPYHTLGATHMAVRDYLAKESCRPVGPNWEIYWSDPGEIENPEQLETEVVYPFVHTGTVSGA